MNSNTKQFIKDATPVVLVFIFFLGFVIWSGNGTSESPTESEYPISTAEAIENYKDATQGKATDVKCDWCGGIGRVGYSGKSEEQCRRTGMGQGNICITCKGSGVVQVRSK